MLATYCSAEIGTWAELGKEEKSEKYWLIPMLNVPSSCTLPPNTGTRLKMPVVQASRGVLGMMVPSTIGPLMYGPLALAVPCSWRICGTESARRHAAVPASVPGQPAAVAKFVPRSRARASDGRTDIGELW